MCYSREYLGGESRREEWGEENDVNTPADSCTATLKIAALQFQPNHVTVTLKPAWLLLYKEQILVFAMFVTLVEAVFVDNKKGNFVTRHGEGRVAHTEGFGKLRDRNNCQFNAMGRTILGKLILLENAEERTKRF